MSGRRATGVHAGVPAARTGPSASRAAGAVVLLHGRGGTAEGILTLATELAVPGLHWVAPQAAGNSWYPHSFLAPEEANEPELSSALARIGAVVAGLESEGVEPRRIAVAGFSQGACLGLEYVARHPRRYGAVVGFTGGLLGPPGTDRDYAGSLDGTPVFLGSGDPDPHVPWRRVEETADALSRLGGRVTLRRYPGMPHTINREELRAARRLLEEMTVARG